MDWQQPDQSSNAPAYSYLPFYNQQDTYQPSYNYDEDNENWDDEVENEDYQNQDAYYHNEHQNVDVAANMGGYNRVIKPPTSLVPPSVALATLETDIQNKAAILKAKLLEKRASSRDVDRSGKEAMSPAFERPAVDHQESDSAIDALVKEARAAAEAEAKQKESTYDEPALEKRVEETSAHQVSPVDSTPTLTPTDEITKKAKKGSQKSSKQVKNAAKAELRAQQLQQQQDATHKMSKDRAAMLAKYNAAQSVQQGHSDIGSKSNTSGLEETKIQARPTIEDKPARSAPAAGIKSPADLSSLSGTLLSASALPKGPVNALVSVGKTSSQVAEDSQTPIASYSRHFDDLDEWLEVTGYHDRGNRERTLSLHRRRAQLERELAEVDRELEQAVTSRARSSKATLGRPASIIPSMPPPAVPEPAIASVGPSPKTGTKRARSSERESQHADKHQRTDLASTSSKPSNSENNGTSFNALDIPRGPRRKDPSPGLNIRGAEKSLPDHRFGQPKDSTRATSFDPHARRNSAAHDRPDHHGLRSRYATREPSPKRPTTAGHGSRSPVSSTWTAYRPAAHEIHKSSDFDQNTAYRGRQAGGRRGGSVSRGRSEHVAKTSALGLGLQRGGCRYFMIKSWNHENVQTARKEGTWATQVQNEEMFTEAFKSSRHVIFFFSVNNSKAFQGYTMPNLNRKETLDALIIGTGFSGVYILHTLRKRGFKVKALDAASQLGGIWNSTYPGARVDIEVPSYELNIEELWNDPTDTFIWKERFPCSEELRSYFRFMDRKLELSRNCRFDTWVESATWDGRREKWTVKTRDGESFVASFFLPCLGYAAKPISPSLNGLESFEGKVVHTAQWPNEGLDLTNKRVGIIGTGASGVQVIQTIAPSVKRLTVFQRTPATAIPMQQREMTKEEITKSAVNDKKDFLDKRASFWDGSPSLMINKSAQDDTPEQRDIEFNRLWNQGGFSYWTSNYNDLFTDKTSNAIIYAWWRQQVQKRLENPAVREVLAPEAPPYAFGTKRVPLEQNYYEAFNMDHVHLVDLRKDSIKEVESGALLMDSGQKHDLDVLILATGFDIGTGGLTQINIQGRDGIKLSDEWSERTRTYLGMAVNGFPNMIIGYGPQSPANVCNGPVCAEVQGDWTVAAMENLRATKRTVMEAMPGAEEEYVSLVTSFTKGSLFEETKSYYHADNVLHREGRKREPVFWMGGVPNYVEKIQQVAKNGFTGFAIS
ncbi:hypothetical protein FKW77_006721 [Venturia effusa]|uniref:YTH domain-containing protein n=1 Tax=Venturia effusa TaxID=50376 RepID=A0A517LHG5_9PEZI|nr:hypothetical protein FKW77_006721 [Venturia effusa]